MDIKQVFEEVQAYLRDLQQRIYSALGALDQEQSFIADSWQRNEHYAGTTCTIENGSVFEKGGVNFSSIAGDKLPQAALVNKPDLANHSGAMPFKVCGLSLVIHPLNPFVPTTHMNIRFFVASPQGHEPLWWFGGGYDLTPYYGFVEDCVHWHETAKKACDNLGPEAYPCYKKWCDEYFYLPHRQEQRGIGGIFFDELNSYGFAQCYGFLQAVGNSFLDAYLPIVKRRMDMGYNGSQRDFQLMRRGRYVEFNLLYDRGTKFGIESSGRTESILVSMPPQVTWQYRFSPEPGSEEARLTDYFLKPRDWLA